MSATLRSWFTCAFLMLAAVSACGGDDDGDHGGAGGPAAPSDLAVAPLSGGAHLTWKDNSDNETSFMVMRMKNGTDPDYQHVTNLPFNATQFHDAPLTSGATYMYMVVAMNDDGETESNEVTFTAP